MSVQIPASHRDLLDGPVVVVFVTVMPNGQPQATPVWCNTDGNLILINSARGRQKDRNIAHNPQVTVFAMDPQNPFRWIEVRGTVVDVAEEGAIEHINALAKLYVGADDYYAFNPEDKGQETRVIFKIEPTRINVL